MSNETSKKPPELEYERPAGITRRGFRLLLLLTFINTILHGANLMGPQTWASIRGTYVSWKNARAAAATSAKNRQAQQALRQTARTFRFPDGYVAYTEVPAEALGYVAQGMRFYPIPTNGDAPPQWQAPVMAYQHPALRGAERLAHDGQLFVHERTSPDGRPMFVVVAFGGSYEFRNEIGTGRSNGSDEVRYRLSKRRELQAIALVPDKDSNDDELKVVGQYQLSLVLPDTQSTEIARATRPSGAERPSATQPVTIRPGNQLRLFGGSPDPADASHFTIPYELDGTPGVIDGWLGNDSLVLRTRQGRSVASAREPTWELLPTTNPTPSPAPAPAPAAPR